MQDLIQFFHFPLELQTHDPDLVNSVLKLQFKFLFEQINEKSDVQMLFNLCLKYLIYLSNELDSNYNGSIDNLTKLIDQIPQETAFLLFYTLFGLVLKESWLGHSYLSVSAEKKIKQEKELKTQIFKNKKSKIYNFTEIINKYKLAPFIQLKDSSNINNYNYYFIKLKEFVFKNGKQMYDNLSADGEEFSSLLPYPHLLLIAKHIITQINQKNPDKPQIQIWNARIAYIHNEFLGNPCSSFQTKIQELYEKAITKLATTPKDTQQKQILALLYIEYSKVSLFYYKYSVSENSLAAAQKLLKIRFDFKGKLGVRSKYQSFKTTQLVVQVINEQEVEEQKQFEEEKKDSVNIFKLLNQEQPKNILLEEESILFEKPKLDEEHEEQKTKEKSVKTELSIYDQIVALGIMLHLNLTSPHDEVYHEQVQAYCDILIDKSLNWLVTSNALFTRSINELCGYKKTERSLLQLENLINQFDEKKPDIFERYMYFHSLNYPYQIDLQRQMADKYMKTGLIMSGSDIFQRLGMHEECIECMIIAGFKAEAENLCKKRLEINPTPKLLCIQGDLSKDISYYKKAWKLSNKKFARAQRSLGRAYYNQQLLEKSIKAFQKAISINSYQIDQWFISGFCYIKLKNYPKAISCFSEVVRIDETYSEAWSNIASAFQQLGKKLEAYSTLEQALKYNEGNWKIWYNFMHVSLANKKFFSFIESIQKLILLNQADLIDENVLKYVNQIFAYQIELYPKVQQKGAFETIKNKIENLYKFMLEKIGQKAFLWNYYGDHLCLLIEYQKLKSKYKISQIKVQKAKQETEKQPDEGKKVNFQVPEDKQENEESLNNQFLQEEEKILNKIADTRLKSCQVLMKIGWEKDKQICAKLFEYMECLIDSYKNVKRQESDKTGLKMLIQTVNPILTEQLGKKIELKFE